MRYCQWRQSFISQWLCVLKERASLTLCMYNLSLSAFQLSVIFLRNSRKSGCLWFILKLLICFFTNWLLFVFVQFVHNPTLTMYPSCYCNVLKGLWNLGRIHHIVGWAYCYKSSAIKVLLYKFCFINSVSDPVNDVKTMYWM